MYTPPVGSKQFIPQNAGFFMMILLVCVAMVCPANALTVDATIPAGTNPYGMVLNPVTKKVYVTDGTKVTVIDGVANTATQVTAGSSGSILEGVAVNPVTNKIYAVDFGNNKVAVIDGLTNAVETVAVGVNPKGIAVNPVTNKIYVANNLGNSITVIDGVTKATLTLPVGNSPTSIAVNPVTNKIYVTNYGSDTVTMINGATNTATTVPLTAGTNSGTCRLAVNPVTNKIYVIHNNRDFVTVIDGLSDTVATTVKVGTLSGGLAAQDVAVNPVTNTIYVSTFNDNTVTVINGTTNTATAVTTGTGPKGMTVNMLSNKVYVANSSTNTITVIDGATNATGTLMVGMHPGVMAVNPLINKIYALNQGSADVSVIDGAGNTSANIVLTPGTITAAINPASNRMYVANPGVISVLDGITGSVITTFGVGISPAGIAVNPVTNVIVVTDSKDNTIRIFEEAREYQYPKTISVGTAPGAVAINPVTNTVYVANNGSSSITVIGETSGAVIETIPVGSGPEYIAVNPVTNTICVVSNNGTISMIDGNKIDGDPNTANVITTLAIGGGRGVAVNPVTNSFYVTDFNNSVVMVIDAATNVVTTLSTGAEPWGVAVNPVTNTVYVAHYGSSSVVALDGVTNTILKTITVGLTPKSLVVDPVRNKIYVVNFGDGTASVIDGATNAVTSTLTVGGAGNAFPALLINPVTSSAYVVNATVNNITRITGQLATDNALTVAIQPMPENTSTTLAPLFTITISGRMLPPATAERIYYQVDSLLGEWQTYVPAGTNKTPGLTTGEHILYAFATDAQVGTVTQSSPVIGTIASYLFVVSGTSPMVLTGAASDITPYTATLNGTVNGNATDPTVIFEYGTTTAYGSSIAATPGSISGMNATAVSAGIDGLLPATTYHYRVTATNSAGTISGRDQTFTTSPGYAVTYNGNGNTGGTVPATSTYVTDAKVTVAAPGTLTRTDYTFGGWEDDGSIAYSPGTIFTINTDITLHAVWTPVWTATVVYDANGSTGGTVPVDGFDYNPHEVAKLLDNSGLLVKPGLLFAGWNTKADGSGITYYPGSYITIDTAGVTTLYAIFGQSATIMYSDNASSGGTVPVDTTTYAIGGLAKALDNSGALVRNGLVFAGWNTKADGSGTTYLPASSIIPTAATTTLYAKWALPILAVENFDAVLPPDFPVGWVQTPPYTPEYWSINSGTKQPSGFDAHSLSNLIVFNSFDINPKMKPASAALISPAFSLTDITNGKVRLWIFRDGGSSSSADRVELYINTLPEKPAGGSPIGIIHRNITMYPAEIDEGWYQYEFAIPATFNGAINYLVINGISKNGYDIHLDDISVDHMPFVVTYDGNGNTGGSVPIDATLYSSNGTVTVMDKGTMEKSGYLFTGWNTKADGSGTAYLPSATFTINSNTTLYAIYTLGMLTISKSGTGNGVITSDIGVNGVPIISCGTTCSASSYIGFGITLTAVPDNGYYVAGWTGCDSTNGPVCTILMTAENNITAIFNAKQNQAISDISFIPATLTVNGTITASATATSDLAVTFSSLTTDICTVSGTTVTGRANGTCTIAADQPGNDAYYPAARVTQDRIITSTLSVVLSDTGIGTVTSSPAGISCNKSSSATLGCSNVMTGTVNLYATPSILSKFVGWGGACSGLGACTVSMAGDKLVTAAFYLAPLLHIDGTVYKTLQDAYNGATDGDVIQLLQSSVLGTLTANKGIFIKLFGGYDANYNLIPGKTTITAPLIIKSGKVSVDRLIVK